MADLILTSPPYNVGSKSPRKDGQRKNGLFDAKSFGGITGYADSMSETEYQKSQIEFMQWAAEHLNPNGILAYNHKPRHRDGRLIQPYEWFSSVSELKQIDEIVWNRGSTHNHCTSFMWQHSERIYIFAKTKSHPKIDNRTRSDVWNIPFNSRDAANLAHCAPFPLDLAVEAILAFSEPNQLICDPYSGSGTTGVAATRTGRSFVGAEREPNYQRNAMMRLEVTSKMRRVA